MIRLFTLVLLMLVTSDKPYAQNSIRYTDLVIAGNKAWILTKTGRLRVIDLQRTVSHDLSIPDDGNIVALAKDRQSNIVIGTRGKYIRAYDSTRRSWKTLGTYSGSLYFIVFDSRNNCYLITSAGVVDLYQHKTYWPDSTLNTTFSRLDIKVQLLSALYMDAQDNLWLGFDHGEWGGDLFVFDTHLKLFHLPRFNAYDLDPVRSIFSDGLWTYVSMGLCHFSTSGNIFRLRYYCSTNIFKSSTERAKDSIVYGQYIGPAAFNPGDHCLYFYSQDGIFRGDPGGDLSKLEKWEKMAEPRLLWSHGQPMAVGSPMNVRKMFFTDDGRLIFLTQLNGIGMMTGRTISFIP